MKLAKQVLELYEAVTDIKKVPVGKTVRVTDGFGGWIEWDRSEKDSWGIVASHDDNPELPAHVSTKELVKDYYEKGDKLTIVEAMHQNTKVRQLEGTGSRKARLTVKEAKRMVENMLDKSNKSPNPKTESDKVALMECSHMLGESMKKLKIVKEVKAK